MLFVRLKDQGGLRFQALRVAVAAHRLRRDPSFLPIAFVLTDRTGRSDTDAFSRLTARCARFNRGDHKLAQINDRAEGMGIPPNKPVLRTTPDPHRQPQTIPPARARL